MRMNKYKSGIIMVNMKESSYIPKDKTRENEWEKHGKDCLPKPNAHASGALLVNIRNLGADFH